MPRLLAALAGIAALAALAALGVAIVGGGSGGGGEGGGCVEIPRAPSLHAGEEFTLQASAEPESSDALPLGTWSRLAFVAEGKRIGTYLDGERVESVAAASLAAEDGELRLGCAAIWGGFSGKIGNVRAYDRALDSAELAAGANPRMYWGAWIDHKQGQSPFEIGVQAEFEDLVGRTASLIRWSSPWEASQYCGGDGHCAFQEGEFETVRAHGSIPFVSWSPEFLSWSGPGAPPSDREIAEGAEDEYVTQWAEAARDWGHPFFLNFAWEMNAPWFRWGVGEFSEDGETFANSAADYVAMWRHVHDVFANRVGADNVTWVWCPNVDPHGKFASMESLYPGDRYVDWTCLDGYNWGKPWRSFDALFRDSYEALAGRIAPAKPVLIGETASTERGGSKAEWIEDMFSNLAAGYPKVHGLSWFDVEDEGPGDWPIESSRQATEAFAHGVRSKLFVGAEYGALETTPIPPP